MSTGPPLLQPLPALLNTRPATRGRLPVELWSGSFDSRSKRFQDGPVYKQHSQQFAVYEQGHAGTQILATGSGSPPLLPEPENSPGERNNREPIKKEPRPSSNDLASF